jgi:hypothetical protein
MSGYAIEYWPGTNLVKYFTWASGPEDVPEGWGYVDENDPLPEVVPSPQQVESLAFSNLEGRQRQALLQITAIQYRIDAIEYLVNGQDEDDPDYMEPTPAEIAELPVRKAQLKSWNNYRAKLGRVTSIAGWYETPTWPAIPETYTSELVNSSEA